MSLSKKFKIAKHRCKGQLLKPAALIQMSKSAVLYSLTDITGKDFHPSKPLAMMVEPSSRCNLKCPECAAGIGQVHRTPGDMDIDLYKKLIDEYSSNLLYVLLFNQGEPFLNKDFWGMIEHSHQKKVYTITSTNGHYIRNDEEAINIINSGLDEIRISLDGLTPEVYEKYRIGGDFNRVVDGVRRLARAKRGLNCFTPIIELQILLTSDTESQIDDARDFGKKLGVDIVSAKTIQLLSPGDEQKFLPKENNYCRYDDENGRLVIKSIVKNRCKRLYFQMQVNSDGSVVPCCFDKDNSIVFGNISNGVFKNIWSGIKFESFRKKILKKRTAIDICCNCTEGIKELYSKKWYIQ
ncbi:MAG: radical SAM protein [candidate division Zixibacteria bacterium]|nr:radical SAM protein [candidate division Zixibacteria bacterium]